MLELIAYRGWERLSDVITHVLRDDLTRVMYPNVTALLEFAAVLPMGTAAVERVFSLMKRVKTRLRSTMFDETLEDVFNVNLTFGNDTMSGLPDEVMREVVEAYRSGIDDSGGGTRRKAHFASYDTYVAARNLVLARRGRTFRNASTQTEY